MNNFLTRWFARPAARTPIRRAAKPAVEGLERRDVPAIYFGASTVTVLGSPANETAIVRIEKSTTKDPYDARVVVTVKHGNTVVEQKTAPLFANTKDGMKPQFSVINFQGGGGSDLLIDDTPFTLNANNAGPDLGVAFDAKAQTLKLTGSARADDIELYDNPYMTAIKSELSNAKGALTVDKRVLNGQAKPVQFLKPDSISTDLGAGDDYYENHTSRDATAHGEAGNNTLIGGSGRDRLYTQNISFRKAAEHGIANGRGGDDVIVGGVGNDLLLGGDGQDQIYGDGGNDTLDGGADNDVLKGGDGNDSLAGGAGHDRLFGNAGDDHIAGGDGDDEIRDNDPGVADHDRIEGGGGNDAIEFSGGTAQGGEGNDTIDIYGSGLAAGGDGDDTLTAHLNGIATLIGGDGNDTLTSLQTALPGGFSYTIMYGLAGNDTMHGGANADQLFGGDGEDTIYGGDGDDVIYGGADHDVLVGDGGADTIHGGAGNDGLLGGTADGKTDHAKDTLYGDAGADYLVFDQLLDVLADYKAAEGDTQHFTTP